MLRTFNASTASSNAVLHSLLKGTGIRFYGIALQYTIARENDM